MQFKEKNFQGSKETFLLTKILTVAQQKPVITFQKGNGVGDAGLKEGPPCLLNDLFFIDSSIDSNNGGLLFYRLIGKEKEIVEFLKFNIDYFKHVFLQSFHSVYLLLARLFSFTFIHNWIQCSSTCFYSDPIQHSIQVDILSHNSVLQSIQSEE